MSDSKDEQVIGDEENRAGCVGGRGESCWTSQLRREFERVMIARATLEGNRVPCAASGHSRARRREKALRVVEGKELRCGCRDSSVVAMEMAVEDSRLGGTEYTTMIQWRSNLRRLLQATSRGGLVVPLVKPLERALSGGRRNGGPLNNLWLNVEIPCWGCWPRPCWLYAGPRTQGIPTGE